MKGTDPTKRTQCDMILQYMREHGSITQAEAMNEIGCTRLAARIADLKDRGHMITSARVSKIGRYGNFVSFSRYYLEEPHGV